MPTPFNKSALYIALAFSGLAMQQAQAHESIVLLPNENVSVRAAPSPNDVEGRTLLNELAGQQEQTRVEVSNLTDHVRDNKKRLDNHDKERHRDRADIDRLMTTPAQRGERGEQGLRGEQGVPGERGEQGLRG
ncbi:collagen-like triple helix repeat-containing protein, partial [Pseudomonas agarici]